MSERSKSVVKSSDIDAIITESIIASRDKLISGYIDSFSRMNRKWTPARAYAEAKRIVYDILSVKAKQYKRVLIVGGLRCHSVGSGPIN